MPVAPVPRGTVDFEGWAVESVVGSLISAWSVSVIAQIPQSAERGLPHLDEVGNGCLSGLFGESAERGVLYDISLRPDIEVREDRSLGSFWTSVKFVLTVTCIDLATQHCPYSRDDAQLLT
jgi:hypothetical protein